MLNLVVPKIIFRQEKIFCPGDEVIEICSRRGLKVSCSDKKVSLQTVLLQQSVRAGHAASANC
jgi:hypothetical protein